MRHNKHQQDALVYLLIQFPTQKRRNSPVKDGLGLLEVETGLKLPHARVPPLPLVFVSGRKTRGSDSLSAIQWEENMKPSFRNYS